MLEIKHTCLDSKEKQNIVQNWKPKVTHCFHQIVLLIIREIHLKIKTTYLQN